MFKFISTIWNTFWKIITFLRTSFFNLIFLLILVVIITSIINAPDNSIPDQTALYVAPEGFLVDELSYTPSAADLLFGSERAPETQLRELIDTIHKAAEDKRITAMVLNLNHFTGGGISKMEELGQALKLFKEASKPIYAYADNYSQQQYFLASYADTIYMTDMGNILLTGFGMYRNYYLEASEKLSVRFHVFRVGDYKDAVEPYMRNDMSDQSREHNQRWLADLWRRYSHVITNNRGLEDNAIDKYISAVASTPSVRKENLSEIALLSGLIDEVMPRNAIKKSLAEQVGADKDDKDTFQSVSYKIYAQATQNPFAEEKKKIGLIVASGVILDGHRDKGSIGGDSLSELIKQASDDDSLEALIIRVNSGGGSAFASEVLRQEILSAKEGGLPVYISMGSMAASGGYWMSTAAEEIWATPTTLTGSIGVWGLIPNVSESVKRLGIHSDGVGTGLLSDIYNIDRPLSQSAQNLIQSGVNDVYQRFLTIVADARGSDPTSVNEIAGGRVWTGKTAKALGLVDKLGSLHDTIEAVAKSKSLADYEIKLIQQPLSAMEEIMLELMQQVNFEGAEKLEQLKLMAKLQNTLPFLDSMQALLQTALQWEEGQQASTFAHCLECYAP
ncbi:protease-4 [Alteromonadaceae bacterium Bs31]|nr:protease-4 [Alteromonadaceae bacterium Bs31]